MKKIDLVRWPGAVLSRIVEPEIEDLDLVPPSQRERLARTMKIGRRVLFQYEGRKEGTHPRDWFLVRISGSWPSYDGVYVSSRAQESSTILPVRELDWVNTRLLGVTKSSDVWSREISPGVFIGFSPEALEGYRLLGIRTPLLLPDSEFLAWWSEVTNL